MNELPAGSLVGFVIYVAYAMLLAISNRPIYSGPVGVMVDGITTVPVTWFPDVDGGAPTGTATAQVGRAQLTPGPPQFAQPLLPAALNPITLK